MLYPVIMAVPPRDGTRRGREKTALLRRQARKALAVSARKNGVRLGTLEKAPNGAPMPSDGRFWSLTHKPRYVAGVLAFFPVGIDIEPIKPVSRALFRKVAADQEWGLGGDDRQGLFFRYWTAKEAVLKAAGVGMAGLSQCRVVRIMDAKSLLVMYREDPFELEHYYFDGHVATVVKASTPVQWTLLNAEDG